MDFKLIQVGQVLLINGQEFTVLQKEEHDACTECYSDRDKILVFELSDGYRLDIEGEHISLWPPSKPKNIFGFLWWSNKAIKVNSIELLTQ